MYSNMTGEQIQNERMKLVVDTLMELQEPVLAQEIAKLTELALHIVSQCLFELKKSHIVKYIDVGEKRYWEIGK